LSFSLWPSLRLTWGGSQHAYVLPSLLLFGKGFSFRSALCWELHCALPRCIRRAEWRSIRTSWLRRTPGGMLHTHRWQI
jgi:hypothetical protein